MKSLISCQIEFKTQNRAILVKKILQLEVKKWPWEGLTDFYKWVPLLRGNFQFLKAHTIVLIFFACIKIVGFDFDSNFFLSFFTKEKKIIKSKCFYLRYIHLLLFKGLKLLNKTFPSIKLMELDTEGSRMIPRRRRNGLSIEK